MEYMGLELFKVLVSIGSKAGMLCRGENCSISQKAIEALSL